jgi:hypothetical protein
MWWIMQLIKDIFHPLKQRKEENENNIYASLKHIVQTQKNKQSQNEEMYHIYHTREKEARSSKI